MFVVWKEFDGTLADLNIFVCILRKKFYLKVFSSYLILDWRMLCPCLCLTLHIVIIPGDNCDTNNHYDILHWGSKDAYHYHACT